MTKSDTARLLTITDVATRLGVSRRTVYKHWPSYLKWGVRPIRLNGNPNSPPRFLVSEIDSMITQWTVALGGAVVTKRSGRGAPPSTNEPSGSALTVSHTPHGGGQEAR
jgi:hypothetical protein